MIKLFSFEGYEVVVEPEALLLKPFKAIYDRDKDKGKYLAKQELAYIYFMGDPRSDYQYIIDLDFRSEEIIKGLGMPAKWKPDAIVKKGLEFYKSFTPASAGLLEDTRLFVGSFRKTLRERSEDLSDMDVRELKEAMALIKEIPKLAKELDEAERALSKDILEDTKARGSQQKALLEDED